MNAHDLCGLRLLLAAAATLLALAAPPLARADTVTDWNRHAASALITSAGQAPPVALLHLAMVHGAVYDAVNSIDRSYRPYLTWAPATPFDSKDAAAATAAYRVLVSIVPAQGAALEALYMSSLAGIPDGPAKAGGIAAGEAAATVMIESRAYDGRFGPFRFTISTAVGAFRPNLPAFVNDPNAWLKDVTPFLIENSGQFRTAGPYPLTSPEYAREFAEVKAVGSLTSTTRTADQTHAARYWAESPAATWSRTARTISAQRGLSLVENARLFAMLYLTAADTAISVWDDKAFWSNWRPITAIREANSDGNPATEADPAWLPLLANPPYPEHPSGLVGNGAAFFTTLQQFLGTDEVAWSDTTGAGLQRSFTRLSQAIDEMVDARVWSGIHFRVADEAAVRIGMQVANWRQQHYFESTRGEGDRDGDGND